MERITLFVEVILPLPVKGTFTYRVPFELNNQVETGKRVVVQFGKRKIYSALIHSIHQTPPKNYQAKYILAILDQTPLVNPTQLNFWEWIASYYMCTIGDVMNAALPAGLKLTSESSVLLSQDFNRENITLNEHEKQVLEALEIQRELKITDVGNIIGHARVLPVIKTLIDHKIIILKEEITEQYKPKKEFFVRLSSEYQDEDRLNKLFDELNKKAYKQLELLLNYFKLSGVTGEPKYIKRQDLLKGTQANYQQLQALVRKGVFEMEEQETSRLQFFDSQTTAESIQLTPAQHEAMNSIKNQFIEKDAVLLHGVTSSGKTEIYIKLINEYLSQGKQVLYLLPEIALTAQIVNRLRKFFGNTVGIYHSRYNEAERIEIWNRVLPPDANDMERFHIILGARSALFLPFHNLGLVIVDEEHDTSFKQYDPAPRYHARDAAIYLARLHNAKTLLGSATPAVETFYNTRTGKYGLVELSERYGGMLMPEIRIVNIKEERRYKRMKSVFSETLIENIRNTLDNKEQSILFQNRRGFSLRLECNTCNWKPQCKNCDVTMIYHKHFNQLRCHYCGYSTRIPAICPQCKSNQLVMKGFGTEKVEEELALILPDIRITRMDLDTTRTKNAHEKIISEFENRKIDVLVGTQMVTKGLDFDHVNVVSILNADNMLSFPDFRSCERGFQLMEQVSGRAGRKNKRGIVIIQTENPGHPIIRNIVDHDYKAMYQHEIMERKKFNYPPFYRLILLRLKHKDPQVLNEASRHFAEQLRRKFKNAVLGPEYPIVSRIKQLYIKQILIKIGRDAPLQAWKSEISKCIDRFYVQPIHKSVRIIPDVDPL